jgi:hypothetical protein
MSTCIEQRIIDLESQPIAYELKDRLFHPLNNIFETSSNQKKELLQGAEIDVTSIEASIIYARKVPFSPCLSLMSCG